MPDRIPVTVLTGFLGSGKTTLLSRLLRSPDFAGTAVIINEFGEIGLDHDLIATSDEALVQLTTGCLCCAVRGDLAQTLLDLSVRRAAGTAAFCRVVIETSGLVDPAPILHALMADAATEARFRLHHVVTVVDAVLGPATLQTHIEAQRQVAAADLVLLSKTDRADGRDARAAIQALNPSARIAETADPGTAALILAHQVPPNRPWLAWHAPPPFARHTGNLTTAVILREHPIPAAAIALLLQGLIAQAGAQLLRVKGLVALAEMPGRPTVIHAVQHIVSPTELLDTWPGADHRTRIVVIGRGIPPYWPGRLLDAIVEEVQDETMKRVPA